MIFPKYVKIANTDFPIIIEDGNYSKELLNLALNDINSIYSQLKEYEISYRSPNRSYTINGENIQTNIYFYAGRQNLYAPSIFAKTNLGYLLEVNGEKHFILSNLILNEYQKAL